MAKDSTTLSNADKDAARKAAKAEKERQRREAIKVATEQVVKAGLPADTKLEPDQRERAVESAEKKAGLAGDALKKYILEGKNLSTQVNEGRANAALKAAEERTRTNVTRSADPEAAKLAVDAKALAPEVKSAFLPKDAREFIDKFKVTGGAKLTIARTDGDAKVSIEKIKLEAFAIGGEKDTDVRKALAEVGKGSRLWGRKLGLMILAAK